MLKGSVTHTITLNEYYDTQKQHGMESKPNMNPFPRKLQKIPK